MTAVARLDGMVAIITGAGGGIGAASATLFAQQGAAVVLVDIRLEAAEKVAASVREAGGRALALAADVGDEADVRGVVDRTLAEFGAVDVLLNNAGVAHQSTLVETTVEDWDRVMAVNLRGSFLLIKHAAPAMDGSGAIVNISSVAAVMAVREAGAYTASKGGVLSLTRVAAAELAPGIRVNGICPGTVRTAMPEEMLRNRGGGDVDAGAALTAQRYLSGRLGEPGEIAATALFLAAPDSSFLTGAVIVADGGVTAQ